MNRILRAPGHDYTSRCIYMITLNKNPLIKKFGTLSGDYRISSGEKNCAVVNLSEIGNAIKKYSSISSFQAEILHCVKPAAY